MRYNEYTHNLIESRRSEKVIRLIVKRDGRKTKYEVSKISDAILLAATQVSADDKKNVQISEEVAKLVDEKLQKEFDSKNCPTVEQIQDCVEQTLIACGYAAIAKEYILQRAERNKTREMKANLMKVMEELTFVEAKNSDIKRENGNIDANTAMGN